MTSSNWILASITVRALGLVAGLSVAAAGCGSSNNSSGTASGTGGATRTGGASGSGGASATGGISGTGGASASGGISGTGGVRATGGANGTGGAPATDGGSDGVAGAGGTSGGAGGRGTGAGGRGTGAGGRAAGGSGSGGSAVDAGARPDAGGNTMSFFATSTGSLAMGGNLGGLAGADAKCQALATAVGQGGKTWHAYLSTSAAPAVNARTRIGAGPWYNARGVMVAASVAQLHDEGGMMNLLSGTNSLDENGMAVPTNQHDMFTGSTVAGMAFPATPDLTCADWTSNAAAGVTAQVGHANRTGGGAIPTSWNSAHATPSCTQAAITMVGGAGRFYCFAIN